MINGAVFFDMDGTLIDSRNGIRVPTEQTREAVARLRERGVLTVLATGRSKCYIPGEFHLFDGYITSNGAYGELNGRTLFNECIAPDVLREVADYLDGIGINYVVEGQERCTVRDIGEYYYKRMMSQFNFPDHSYYPLKELNEFPVNKLMVSYDLPQKAEQFKTDYKDRLVITDHPVNSSCDVSRAGITKGYGVKMLMEKLAIPRERTWAFGDADNDLDMLAEVGTGIAMGEHTPRLGAIAAYITGTVKCEGISAALRHFGLI